MILAFSFNHSQRLWPTACQITFACLLSCPSLRTRPPAAHLTSHTARFPSPFHSPTVLTTLPRYLFSPLLTVSPSPSFSAHAPPLQPLSLSRSPRTPSHRPRLFLLPLAPNCRYNQEILRQELQSATAGEQTRINPNLNRCGLEYIKPRTETRKNGL